MAPSLWSSLRACALTALFSFSCTVSADAGYIPGATVSSTILVLARDDVSAKNGAYLGLEGYGIPYEVLTVPQAGISALPVLNSSATNGNYGGIVVVSEVGYNYGTQYYSALTRRQWEDLWDYQTQFGVRMVRLDVFPTSDFGVVSSSPGNVLEQPIYFTNMTGFPTANLVANQNISVANIFHNPAQITNSSMAWEFAHFAGGGTAGVINQIGDRQQMVWFLPFALDWSATSSVLQHAWIHWVTRGLYVGMRRLMLQTQVDDMFLETPMYRPEGQTFRVKGDDLAMHIDWMADINTRLPAGSDYFMEIGHNGNGDIEAASDTTDGETYCKPDDGIEYPDQIDGPPDYTHTPGTGYNLWPNNSKTDGYKWSLDCAEIDDLENWFEDPDNLNAFAHISHTFTHEDLTNATNFDALREITWNQAWLKQVGISSATRWSGNGIIPPAITGLHNADVIRAWLSLGIDNVVGDNTRPLLLDLDHPFWPLNSTVEANGYAGLNIMPRWASIIYYNCDLPACTLQEWIDTSGGSGDFNTLILNARDTAVRNFMGLHQEPYMFHQANLRVSDVPETTVVGKQGQYSLLMTWVETVIAETTRLTTWPYITKKHDDLAAQFLQRKARDLCRPSMTWQASADGKSIDSVTVFTAGGNSCGTTIPITVPAPVSSTTGATKEQLGTDPLTLWVTMSGASRTYKFAKPIPL